MTSTQPLPRPLRIPFPVLVAGLLIASIGLVPPGDPNALAAGPSEHEHAPSVVRGGKVRATGPRPTDWTASVLDYGAVGDGLHDDTAALQRAIDTFQSSDGASGGGTLHLPPGTYLISETIVIEGATGLQLIGSGVEATELLWAGAASGTVLELNGTESCLVEGMRLGTQTGYFADCTLKITATAGWSIANEFRRLLIDGAFTPRSVRIRGGRDHLFENVIVRQYTEAGFSLESKEIKGVVFQACAIDGHGEFGVATHLDDPDEPQPPGGSFSWFGGSGTSNYSADFFLGDATDGVLISGGRFNNSGRLLATSGPSGNQKAVTIQSVVWNSQMLGNGFLPDHLKYRIVDFQFRGPLILIGNQLGTPPDPSSPSGPSSREAR